MTKFSKHIQKPITEQELAERAVFQEAVAELQKTPRLVVLRNYVNGNLPYSGTYIDGFKNKMAIRIGILSKKYEASYADYVDASDAHVPDHEQALAVLTEEEHAFLTVLDGFIAGLPERLDLIPHQEISAYPESHQSAMKQIFKYRSEIFKDWYRNQGVING